MKAVIGGLAFAILGACTTSPPGSGTVYFNMDNVSCTYLGAKDVTFYIAAEEAGTESMVTSATSKAYITKVSTSYATPGNPVVHARIANYTPGGGALWTSRTNINVTAKDPVTHTIHC